MNKDLTKSREILYYENNIYSSFYISKELKISLSYEWNKQSIELQRLRKIYKRKILRKIYRKLYYLFLTKDLEKKNIKFKGWKLNNLEKYKYISHSDLYKYQKIASYRIHILLGVTVNIKPVLNKNFNSNTNKNIFQDLILLKKKYNTQSSKENYLNSHFVQNEKIRIFTRTTQLHD